MELKGTHRTMNRGNQTVVCHLILQGAIVAQIFTIDFLEQLV